MEEFNKKNEFSLSEIKQHYSILQNDMEKKDNEFLKLIYIQFSFQFLLLKENEVETKLFVHLKNVKFITFKIFNEHVEDSNKIANIVIVFEKKCIFIKNINVNSLLLFLRKNEGSFINLNSKKINDCIKEEISNFCSYFLNECDINKFVKFSIYPIAAFLIRRFYCPSNYFQDPSFFSYSFPNDKSNNLQNNFSWQAKEISENINETNDQKIQYENFQEKDFIVLRIVHSSSSYFYLVFHIKKLYLFIYKKIINFDMKSISNEISFCTTNRHRCIMKFYGFVLEKKTITGFIYEFMSNGTLWDFISANKVTDFFKYTTIIRIFDAINYLHLHSIIHRDIKNDNILVDHDNKCYLADFDKIKINYSTSHKDMTCDFATVLYASPEQLLGEDIHGNPVSFPTDIYSFGHLIYFIFEKKDYFDTFDVNEILGILKKKQFREIAYVPNSIQELFKKCIDIDPNERPSIKFINSVLCNQENVMYFIDNFFFVEKNENINIEELYHYFNEILFFMYQKIELSIFDKNAEDFSFLFKSISSKNISDILYNIGLFYEEICSKKNCNNALKYYEMSEKFNNSNAQLKLGSFYYYGNCVEQNIQLAKIYIKKSAKQNNSNALYFLGYIYLYGESVEVNYTKAKKYLELSAKLNNSDALYCLGIIYSDALGVDQDNSKAKEYYELSAKLNNSNAYFCLGNIFYEGIGVETDYSKAKYFFELAAKQNNSSAIYYLGILYYNGEGVQQNYKKSIEYFELSAKLNNSDSQNFLGQLYYNGIYFDKNYDNAKHYFELAAQQNNSMALYNLSNLYIKGLGVKKDYQKAREYLLQSAQENNSDALNSLGYIYYKGIGVNIDYQLAKEYFIKSSKLENGLAYFNLGDFYYNGYSESKDFDRAIYYYKLAKKQNISEAFYNIGKMYNEGNGKEKNFYKAKKYYKLSAKLNNSNGLFHLGKLYYDGINCKQKPRKAKKYFLEASLLFNFEAFFYLGLIYYEGLDGKKNYKKAYEYFSLAAEKSNPNAYYYLGLMHELGQGVERDLTNAIYFYTKCCEKQSIKYIYEFDNNFQEQIIKNYYYYLSNNNLGIIYITDNEKMDLKKADKYLKESGFNEYTHAQVNLGLYYKNILKKDEDAKYFFDKAARKHFSLAEFNIGCNYEKNGQINESIEHYKKSLEYFNEPLYCLNQLIKDDWLEISKCFINCYTNLKMVNFYFSEFLTESDNVLKYFLNAIFVPIFILLFQSECKSFQFIFDVNNNKSNLKQFFLQFPLFNISNNNSNREWIELTPDSDKQSIKKIIISNRKTKRNDFFRKKICDKKCNIFDININMHHFIKSIFTDLCKNKFEIVNINMNKNEFRFISKYDKIERILEYSNLFFQLEYFQNEIQDIITELDVILFKYPYSILLGRIPICSNINNIKKYNINDSFYEGFGIQ